jgi:hypothetical protein
MGYRDALGVFQQGGGMLQKGGSTAARATAGGLEQVA